MPFFLTKSDMKFKLAFLCFIVSFVLFGQDSLLVEINDTNYREDQFYMSISHQFFTNRNNIEQNSFSPTFSLGYLRDFPIDSKRQIAIAPGFGINYRNLKTSALLSPFKLDEFDNFVYSDQRINQFRIETPLEFRFRNSNPYNHAFFRVHFGVKASFLILHQSRLEGFDTLITNNKSDFNQVIYDTYISLGYNTFNVYFSYGLNPIFKNNQNFYGDQLNLNRFELGLIFYIL